MSKKKVAPKAKTVKREMDVTKNELGKSEAYDKAIEASVTLISHFYHASLKKYVTEDGQIIDSITVPGQGEGAEAIKVSGIDSLTFDLEKLTQLALRVNHLQRLRQDASLDITLNPLNVQNG